MRWSGLRSTRMHRCSGDSRSDGFPGPQCETGDEEGCASKSVKMLFGIATVRFSLHVVQVSLVAHGIEGIGNALTGVFSVFANHEE